MSLRFKFQEVPKGIEAVVEELTDYDNWNDVRDGFDALNSENPADVDALLAVENALKYDLDKGMNEGRFSSYSSLNRLTENLRGNPNLDPADVEAFLKRTNDFVRESVTRGLAGTTEGLLRNLGLDASAQAWNTSMEELDWWHERAEGPDFDFDAVGGLIDEIQNLGLDRLTEEQRGKLDRVKALLEVRDVTTDSREKMRELADLVTAEGLSRDAKLTESGEHTPDRPVMTVASTVAELPVKLNQVLATLSEDTTSQFGASAMAGFNPDQFA